jgi:hypothetical protein
MSTLPPSPFLSAESQSESNQRQNGYGTECAHADRVVIRPDAGRSASTTSENLDVTAGETAPHSDFESVTPARAPTTAAAGANAAVDFLDDIGDIHEIFHHARKLVADDHRFVLDEVAFADAIEPMPLFLQRAAG